MITENFTFQIDKELKREAEDLFADFGMDLPTAINMFLRQSVREQQIPFAITRNVPNEVIIPASDDTFDPMEGVFEFFDELSKYE
jgi:DNA-damage-inducible protein J